MASRPDPGWVVNTDSDQYDDLIHLWTTEDCDGVTLEDQIGSLDGTLGSGNSVIDAGDSVGDVIDFDGTSDSVFEAGSIDIPEEGTLMFIFYKPSAATGVERVMGGADNAEIRVKHDGAEAGVLSHEIFQSGTDTTYSTTKMDDATYYFCAMTWDAADDSTEFYVDGTEEADYPGDTTPADDDPGTVTWSFGVRTGTTNYFTGRLGEIRMYDAKLSSTIIGNFASDHWDLYKNEGGRPMTPNRGFW